MIKFINHYQLSDQLVIRVYRLPSQRPDL